LLYDTTKLKKILVWWRSFGSNFEEMNKYFSVTINFYKKSVLAGTEGRIVES
jgi:hypothetical protein